MSHVRATLLATSCGRISLQLAIQKRRVPRRQRKSALAAESAENSATICFDVGSFSGMQSDAEIAALARQLVQCYAFNRSLSQPFRFALAGLERSAIPAP